MTITIDLPLQDNTVNTIIRAKVGNNATGSLNTNILSQSGPGGYYNKSMLFTVTRDLMLGSSLIFPAIGSSSAGLSFWIQHSGTVDMKRLGDPGSAPHFSIGIITIGGEDDNANELTPFSITGISSGNWNHIVLNQTGDFLICYVNGVLAGTGDLSSNGWEGFTISNGLDFTQNARLAGFRHYDAALNATEIESDYNRGLTSQTLQTDIYPSKFYDDNIKYSQACTMINNTTYDVQRELGSINIDNIKNKYDIRFKHNLPPTGA